jgi:NADH:ubiquinone oxidoreductase subunit D
MADVEGLLNKNRIFRDRTVGVGVISREDAIAYGFTGPNLRATGKQWDIRRAFPYLTYDRYEFDIPTHDGGDIWARYWVRLEEMRQSIRIIRQAIKDIPGGRVISSDFKHVLPDKDEVYNTIEGLIHHFEQIIHGIRPLKGEAYASVEAANGELGFYLVSDGGRSPYRLRIRPPCFIYFQAFEQMVKGHLIADLVGILGSINIIAGELDR